MILGGYFPSRFYLWIAHLFEVGKLFMTVLQYFIIDESLGKNPE